MQTVRWEHGTEKETNDNTRNVRADVEIYPDNGVIAFCVQGLSDDGELTAEESVDVPMNFCPACGRKLGY